MDNFYNADNWKLAIKRIGKPIKELAVMLSAFSAIFGTYTSGFLHETYIRDPRSRPNKYNRIKDLAYNHRKYRVREKNLKRLNGLQIVVYAGWDLSNCPDANKD